MIVEFRDKTRRQKVIMLSMQEFVYHVNADGVGDHKDTFKLL